jgi:hypothetical protein
MSLSNSYFYIRPDGDIVGPLTLKNLREVREDGHINDETSVRRNNEQWTTYTNLFTSPNQQQFVQDRPNNLGLYGILTVLLIICGLTISEFLPHRESQVTSGMTPENSTPSCPSLSEVQQRTNTILPQSLLNKTTHVTPLGNCRFEIYVGGVSPMTGEVIEQTYILNTDGNQYQFTPYGTP